MTQVSQIDGGSIMLSIAVLFLVSIVLLLLAVKATLAKSTGKERNLWLLSFLLVPIICPAAALIYFKNKDAS